ncbi:unnamed protein product [Didymodactylos carnosus]|uniref:Ribonucleoside-diphosphate reductase n=1 Tax=Didymodactylos carnosus TaxID=1234261 RepID=A0A814L506_9BILA|nr:unnamed protein product [Didymodactylos carnosus]CAF1060252.1 unnamed protein product [Didymodactylos carnosus]CAF3617583.1 unnamed protein product [Didymodactylos carnosus]CAF3828656.1 unnamed protein product [Didymodactylos carnosus]
MQRTKSSEAHLFVIKRDGRKESAMFDKITSRIAKLSYGLDLDYIDPAAIALQVINFLHPGVTTIELDNLAAQKAASMTAKHPHYGILAGRIAVSNLHKETKEKFSDVIKDMYDHYNPDLSTHAPMISQEVYDIVMEHAETLDAIINHERDFDYNYFGFKTLERSYLRRIGNLVVERPQHMLMRVSLGIHGKNLEDVKETYNLLSEKWFTHATPTLFNSGTTRAQMASCYLLTMVDDSIEGIFETLGRCAIISKYAGGIGLSISSIRASGSYIEGTNGQSDGILPMMRVFNNVARYVNQGGKRPGAYAVYLEPWHADIFDFLDARKNTGAEEKRARDLFLALWIPDLFMRRVEANEQWTLMCPHQCKNLENVWGKEFEELYIRYENEGLGRRKVKAQELWFAIINAQIETGNPFMLYKDHCNSKSNQQHLGTIHCSNLCTEIIEYTSPDEVAVCNLASIALNRFVRDDRTFDFDKLVYVTGVIVKNLNKIIDVNYYPLPQAEKSNLRHRPIGIGVQGLADTFALMRYPFDSVQAQELNRLIFETIYYGALKASTDLAEKYGTYETYQGSPVSKGILQFDMWNVKPSDRWNWQELRDKIAKYGTRNSLLLAPMPTASTAQILGNNESIEPYTNNMYVRRVLSGEFQVVNDHLLKDLTDLRLWNDDMKHRLMNENGSVQNIDEIPDDIKALYKTVWEIPQKTIINMAADRGAFIDQSQSLNIHIAEPTVNKLSSMHFYAWKKGLKTGMYYLRTRPAADPIKFTVDKSRLTVNSLQSPAIKIGERFKMACSLKDKDDGGCLMCSS